MSKLSRRFYVGYTPDVARGLLGKLLVRTIGSVRVSGMIVETEAYRGSQDPASHAFRGKTIRNKVMFGEPGHAYVYFTMGLHYCLNITTEPEDTPGAVLIRAIEPVEGVGLMLRNRGVDDPARVTRGPANLTKALGIDLDMDGEDMVRSERLFVEKGKGPMKTSSSARVGISKGRELRWRFFVDGNPFVSRGAGPKPPRTHN